MKSIIKLGCLTFLMIFGTTSCSAKYNTLDDILEKKELVVATNAEFAPFEYKEGEEFFGIDIDIIKAYCKHIGVECKIVDQEFDAALLSCSTAKADVAIAGVTRNAVREKTLSFSNPYYTANQVVIVKKDSIYSNLKTNEELLQALSNNKAKIGVQINTTGQYYVEGDEEWKFDGIKDAECLIYDNGPIAGKALSQGKIDAIIIDSAPADIIASSYEELMVLPCILTEEEYAIAVTKNNTTLVESLNEFIEIIKANGEFEKIVSKYF